MTSKMKTKIIGNINFDYGVAHRPFESLEQFRNALVDKYLEIHQSDVLVFEKIHGSNIQIMGIYNDGKWNVKIGSRKRWITSEDKFNNIQQIYTNNITNIHNLFDDAVKYFDYKDGVVVRIYGEVFGGKYGGKSSPSAMKTQSEPNYGYDNDVAFFGMTIDGVTVPILRVVDLIKAHNLKHPPIIFQGQLADFLKDFDVNKFQSRVSSEFYDLEFLDTPKATEGVTIQTINPDATGDEAIIRKYKQTWAVENRRVTNPTNIVEENHSEIEKACMDMMNYMRFVHYNSKNTIDDMTNPRMIGNHIKNIIADTMRDVDEEFPNNKYPQLNRKNISRMLTKKAFPMFKEFVADLNVRSQTPEERMNNLITTNQNLSAQVNIMSQRLSSIMQRIEVLSS